MLIENVVTILKGWQSFFDPTHSFSCRGENADFWPLTDWVNLIPAAGKNVVTLKSKSQVTPGYWKWYHLIDWVRFPTSVPFLEIRLQKCRDLENRVRRSSRSLEMSPFDAARTTSYWRSILWHFWDIQCRKMSWLEIRVRGHSGSLKVIPFDRLPTVSY